MTVGPIPEWVERYQATIPPLSGAFFEEDLHLFALINEIQLAAGVPGDLLEVGAYLAKSSVALGFMCRETESLTVVDPWESKVDLEENAREQDRCYGGAHMATLEAFVANYRRFHDELPDIRQGPSSQHLKDLPAERFRFIHIDGSHEWRVMLGDVDQVLRLLSSDGVVAFDDLFMRHCVGVGAAVWPACVRGELVPVATTNKLYATRGPSGSVSAASLARAVDADPDLALMGRHPVLGSDVLEVAMSPPPPPLLPRLRPYVPPKLVDLARAHSLGPRVRRALARTTSLLPETGRR